MKNLSKAFSLLLALITVISAFAVMPAAAEGASEPEIDNDILWSVDFDDYDPSKQTYYEYLDSKGFYTNGFTGSIEGGKIHNPSAQWWSDSQAENDTFRDLFYGLYTDENGNLLNDYYMDIGYTMTACSDTKSFTFTGTEDGKAVTYKITTPYRGDSYFNPLSGGGYHIYFFKVSPTGYLYTPGNIGNVTFTTADGGDANLKYFTYTKSGGSGNVNSKTPITKAVWEEMRANCGTDISAPAWDRVHLTGDNFYQLELGKEYTIRIKFSVASDNKVTATTYVRPADSSEAFSKVGSTSYKCSDDGKGEYAKAVRISENFSAYSFDNITFVGRGACDGEHEFPILSESSTNADGFSASHKYSCLKCGAIYYSYEKSTELQSFDFTAMTSAEFEAFKTGGVYNSNSATMTLSEGNGLTFTSTASGTNQGGPDVTFNTPISDKSYDYRMSFRMKINKLPIDQVNSGNHSFGSSFLTDRTGGGFNMFLRFGRDFDYETTKKGWLKIRPEASNTNWGAIPTAFVLEEGKTYDFSVVLRPSISKFDLYIDGQYIGRGWIPTWDGTAKRVYRIANQMQTSFVLENYSISRIESTEAYPLLNGIDAISSTAPSNMKFVNDPVHGAIYTNVTYENSNTSGQIMITDTELKLKSTPYSLSFDFMMTDSGEYKDSAESESALWSLVSWLNGKTTASADTKYGTMLRVGGIDNDEGKKGFERFFIVLDTNGSYTESNDNGNQAYTSNGQIAGYYSDKSSVYNFGVGEWITVTLTVNPITNSLYLYVNGELVAVAPGNAINKNNISNEILVSRLRIGDSFRKLHYNWAIKDVNLEFSPEKPNEVKDSGTLYALDFGKSYVLNTKYSASLGAGSPVGSAAAEKVKDTADAQGYTRFTANGGNYMAGTSYLYNLSMTGTAADGSYYNYLDGSKYAIETTFALYDRAPSQKEINELNAYNEEKGKDLTLPQTASDKNTTIIRMSKYHDNNKCEILYHDKTGIIAITAEGNFDLYTKNGDGEFVNVSAWYTDSDLVNGVLPESKWVHAKAVIDEPNGTFSVFLNGNIAYYLDGSVYKRAEGFKMNVTTGNSSLTKKFPNAPESVAWNASPSYSTIPRTVTVDGVETSYGTSGISIVSYIRFFQTALDYVVRDIKITKIDDGLNFVGTQTKNNDDNFDLRFIFGLDDIYADGIEYDVTVDVNGGGESDVETAESTTVFRTLRSESGDVNAWKLDSGEYFSLFRVDNVEFGSESDRYVFRVTPYLKKLNTLTGTIERDMSSAKITHVITTNGLGETVSYATEDAAWANIKSVYTDISSVPYKALGRTQMLNGALTADWSAAGIEFEASCVGDVSITLASSDSRKFTVVVDGVEYKDVTLTSGQNVIASNLPYGKHSFKIMNQSGYNGAVNIAGVTIKGEFCERPADSDLLIEFIGDSITHGCGLGSPNYSDGTNDGTLTYAFLAAKELGADYTIMANGGMGLKWGSDYSDNDLNRSMKKYPYLNDAKRGDALYTGYTRAADIVVIGLSTNDNYRFELQYKAEQTAFKAENPNATADELSAHMAAFTATKMADLEAEIETLIAEIEKHHGKDVPIVLARGMMEQNNELYLTSVTHMTYLFEEKWQGKYGDHVLMVAHLTPDRTGASGHPKREGAAIQGKELAEFIKTNFPELVSSPSLEKKTYTFADGSVNYLLYTPENAGADMPLIVYLHGGSEKGDDLDLITAVDGFPQYLRDGKIAPNAYVLIPQVSSEYKGWADMKADVMKLINYIKGEYPINPNKISLTGHSMGGTGTWTLALEYPASFSAIAPLSGSVTLSDLNLNKLSSLPVWAIVGSDDTIVDPQSSVDFINELSKTNDKASITILNGADHFEVPNQSFLSKDLNLLAWLIAQSK